MKVFMLKVLNWLAQLLGVCEDDMPKRVQIIGHNAAEANEFVGRAREVTADTTNGELRLHDGATAGGHRILNKAANDALYTAKNENVFAWDSARIEFNAEEENRDFIINANNLPDAFFMDGATGDIALKGILSVDEIVERTEDAGVTVDGVNIGDFAAAYNTFIARTDNPHGVTKAQVGLGDVLNAVQLVAANNLSDVADVPTARNNLAAAAQAIEIIAGSGLTGGGTLAANRTLNADFANVTDFLAGEDEKLLTPGIFLGDNANYTPGRPTVGHLVMPGGLIINWGNDISPIDSWKTVAYSKAFTQRPFALVGSVTDSNAAVYPPVQIGPAFDNNQGSHVIINSGSSLPWNVSWIAIGT